MIHTLRLSVRNPGQSARPYDHIFNLNGVFHLFFSCLGIVIAGLPVAQEGIDPEYPMGCGVRDGNVNYMVHTGLIRH